MASLLNIHTQSPFPESDPFRHHHKRFGQSTTTASSLIIGCRYCIIYHVALRKLQAEDSLQPFGRHRLVVREGVVGSGVVWLIGGTSSVLPGRHRAWEGMSSSSGESTTEGKAATGYNACRLCRSAPRCWRCRPAERGSLKNPQISGAAAVGPWRRLVQEEGGGHGAQRLR